MHFFYSILKYNVAAIFFYPFQQLREPNLCETSQHIVSMLHKDCSKAHHYSYSPSYNFANYTIKLWLLGKYLYCKHLELHRENFWVFYTPQKFSLLIYNLHSECQYIHIKLFSFLSKAKLQKFFLNNNKIQWTAKLFSLVTFVVYSS